MYRSKYVSRRSPLRPVVTVLVILLSFFSEASSQWVKVSSKAFPFIGSSGGMLHFKNGVLWGGYRNLKVSLDTGRTWSTKIASFPNINDFLMNIDFVDAQTGLVRTSGNNSSGNIFYTNDQGMNWTSQTPPGMSGSRYTVFAGSSGIVISCARDGIYSSYNGGVSFVRTYSGATPNILTYRPTGVIAAFEAARVVLSTDFGQTWSIKPFDQTLQDSYSMGFDLCDSNRLYLANEDFFVKHNNVSEVLVSADRGVNWTSKNQQSLGVFNGAMAVTQNAAYFQTISSGLYRTTDGGNNWTNIPAPTSYADSRMLVALTDNILVCIDQNGDVWRTDNSGGFPVAPQAIPLLTDPRAITVKSCSSDSTLLMVIGPNCKMFNLTRAIVTGADSALFSIRSSSALPKGLTQGGSDTIRIVVDSKNAAGNLQANVKLTWNDGSDHDTTIALQVTVLPAPPKVATTQPLMNFGLVAPCSFGHDTTVTIRNIGCSDLNIISGPGSLTPGFTMDPVLFPIRLEPDSSASFVFHFRPTSGGTYTTKALFFLEAQGLGKTDSITLSGQSSGNPTPVTLYNSPINFDTVSICRAGALEDTVVTITNSGCDTLHITSGPGNLAAGFTCLGLNLPLPILPDSTARIHFRYQPTTVGTTATTAHFTVMRGGVSQDLPITLNGRSVYDQPGPLLADSAINFGTVSACDPFRDSIIFLSNQGCDTLFITAAAWGVYGAFTIDPQQLPIILPPDSSIGISVKFSPPSVGVYAATFSVKTIRRGTSQNLLIDIAGSSIVPPAGPVAIPTIYQFDTLTICDGLRDTVITLTNRACDDLKITSGPGILPIGFTCDAINWPVTLLPDSSMVVRFHYTPSITGSFEAYPHFETERSGKKGIVDLILHADAKAGSSILSLITPTLSLGPLPICAVDSQMIVYTNTGCDNLYVTPSGLVGDNDYLSSSGSETKLAPGDTIRILVKIVPQQKGLRIASYKLHIRKASGEVFDTIVSIAASVTDGTKQLQCPVTAIDFPPVSLCPNTMDTTVTLRNNGCDTLWVNGFGLSGSGFSVTPPPPFFIEPGASKDIIIHCSLVTFDHRSTNTGAVFITSTSDVPLAPIVLNQSYIYPGNYPIRIQVPTKANVGDTILIKIFADSLPYGLAEFVADLSIGNSDLLSFVRYEGPNVLASMNGDQIRFTGNPIVTKAGLLAEFFYKVYLTADTATKINFSGVHFNPADPSYEQCIATPLSSNTEGYNSIFRCGEHTISDVMRGDAPMRISSVHPNPTSGELTVDLDIKAASDIEAAVIDQLGRELKSVTVHLESGRQNLSLDVTNVASGIYHLRIKTATTSVETSFVKTR